MRRKSGQPAQMKVEQSPCKAPTTLTARYRHGKDFRLIFDQTRHDEASQPCSHKGAVCNDVAIKQKAFDFLFAPSTPEGCAMQSGNSRCVARPCL